MRGRRPGKTRGVFVEGVKPTVHAGERTRYLGFAGVRALSLVGESVSRGSLICNPISCNAFPYCPQYSRARTGVCSYFSKQARYDFKSKVASL